MGHKEPVLLMSRKPCPVPSAFKCKSTQQAATLLAARDCFHTPQTSWALAAVSDRINQSLKHSLNQLKKMCKTSDILTQYWLHVKLTALGRRKKKSEGLWVTCVHHLSLAKKNRRASHPKIVNSTITLSLTHHTTRASPQFYAPSH